MLDFFVRVLIVFNIIYLVLSFLNKSELQSDLDLAYNYLRLFFSLYSFFG